MNGLSPRADEATTPEENTTNPKMPTQTNNRRHPDDKKETFIKIEGGGLAPGEHKMSTALPQPRDSDESHAPPLLFYSNLNTNFINLNLFTVSRINLYNRA